MRPRIRRIGTVDPEAMERGKNIAIAFMEEHQLGWDFLLPSSDWRGFTDIIQKRAQLIRLLREAGLTVREIGLTVNRHHTTITHWLCPGRRERRLPEMRRYTSEAKRRRRQHVASTPRSSA